VALRHLCDEDTRKGETSQRKVIIGGLMAEFFNRRVLGTKNRGCRTDPVTGQTVQFMPHSGDIVYKLQGSAAISKKSELKFSRELTLNPATDENLNEIGQNKKIVKRTATSRYVKLD